MHPPPQNVFYILKDTTKIKIEVSVVIVVLFITVPWNRVASDLENLEKSGNFKETSESQGIYLKRQGICETIPKVREFCCLKFIFSQVEDPNYENFLGEHATRPP